MVKAASKVAVVVEQIVTAKKRMADKDSFWINGRDGRQSTVVETFVQAHASAN